MTLTAPRQILRIYCSMQKLQDLICLQDFRRFLKEKIASRLMRLLMCTVVSTAIIVASKFLIKIEDT
uniref:Uncharacterized protein n=1 Tax=Arundo donax TaxID=35708 RepID=A0A0A9GC76_ARUDO